jgi:NADH dehydrogenase
MKIIIVGGGFAGLNLARALNDKDGIEVLLIDRYNYHQFQPLFYQVATGSLDASNISFPLRKVFHKSRNVRFRLAHIQEVISAQNKIRTDIGEFEYDMLVLATGADSNFFGNQNLIDFTFPMKSTIEAIQLRNRLIQIFEDALLVQDPTERESLMRIVVVGGGPTGTEVSGTLAEMKRKILPKDYPELDFSKMEIILLEGLGTTLAPMSEKSQQQSMQYLSELGVKVMVNTLVKDYDGDVVTLTNGNTIPSKTVIWAAGIKGNVPAGIDSSLVVRGNRIKVDRFNKVEGSANIFAIGDLCYMETPLYPKGHPQLANVAINQGKTLAKNIIAKVKNASAVWREFEYNDKGSMATVGRHRAVVDVPKPKLHFGGLIAWYIWMILHLFLILGVKNKVQIFINWLYKYFTFDQSLRLLFKDIDRDRKKVGEKIEGTA